MAEQEKNSQGFAKVQITWNFKSIEESRKLNRVFKDKRSTSVTSSWSNLFHMHFYPISLCRSPGWFGSQLHLELFQSRTRKEHFRRLATGLERQVCQENGLRWKCEDLICYLEHVSNFRIWWCVFITSVLGLTGQPVWPNWRDNGRYCFKEDKWHCCSCFLLPLHLNCRKELQCIIYSLLTDLGFADLLCMVGFYHALTSVCVL